MKGWKTWVSVAIATVIGLVNGLEQVGWAPPGTGGIALAVLTPICASFGLVGLGHKMDKIKQ